MKLSLAVEQRASLEQRFRAARKSSERWDTFVASVDDDDEVCLLVHWAVNGLDAELRWARAYSRNLSAAVDLAFDEGCSIELACNRQRGVFEADVSYEHYNGRGEHDFRGCVATSRHDCRARALCSALLDIYSPTEDEIDAEAVEEDRQSTIAALQAAHPDATIGHMRWQWPDGTVILDTPVAWGPVVHLADAES